jgi:glycerophosphoryl diester phosphodiesterase
VLQPDRGLMSADFLAYAHENGMRANVFYADTPEDMNLYMNWGGDGILTNVPALMKEVLATR